MPNVNSNREKYSKEIGIKVAERPPEPIALQSNGNLFLPDNVDKLQEIR